MKGKNTTFQTLFWKEKLIIHPQINNILTQEVTIEDKCHENFLPISCYLFPKQIH